jgi:hypothetical protein
MNKKANKPAPQEAPDFDFSTIKTFEDACKHIRITTKLPDVSALMDEDLRKPVIANYKLMVIFKAINNGWRPDWSNWNQYKYYPWFRVLSSGFGFSGSRYGCDHSVTGVGSRLCTDSSEKALYIAKQFEELYKECFLYSE